MLRIQYSVDVINTLANLVSVAFSKEESGSTIATRVKLVALLESFG